MGGKIFKELYDIPNSVEKIKKNSLTWKIFRETN